LNLCGFSSAASRGAIDGDAASRRREKSLKNLSPINRQWCDAFSCCGFTSVNPCVNLIPIGEPVTSEFDLAPMM